MRSKDIRFQAGRVAGLLRTMLRNKMALVGLILLLGSVFVALAAPILTPYSPTTVVSGVYSEPGWVLYFPDGYRLSQNVQAVPDPMFSSPSAVQGWTLDASGSTLQNLIMSYAPGVSLPGSPGSLQLDYLGAGPATVTLGRTFDFPYHGPPLKFIGQASIMVSGASPNPVGATVLVNRLGDRAFDLWSSNLTGRVWTQSGSIDSQNYQVRTLLGMQGAPLDPAAIIFSSRQQYSYGIQLVFNGPARVNIDGFQLQLVGNAWGIFGTDVNGNDIFTQLIYGSRISLMVGLSAAGIGISLGLLIGLLAGFMGTIIDQALMRTTDMMLVIPQLPLFIVLVAVLGASITNIILVIGFFSWMGFARIIRSQVLTLKERPFIEAARAAGSGSVRILSRHIFPNIVSLTYVNLALTVPGAILTEAALGFLGLFDPNAISWGHMFALAQDSGGLFVWWWVVPPGLAIAAVSLSFVLIGYSLDEIFNPKLRQRR